MLAGRRIYIFLGFDRIYGLQAPWVNDSLEGLERDHEE